MKRKDLVDTGILVRYLQDLKKEDLKEVPEEVIDIYFADWLMNVCEDPYSLVSLKREAIILVNKYRNVVYDLEILCP